MAVVVVIGVLLALAGVVLLLNLAGAGGFVMRHVTSRYLGSLPPGFANTKRGFRVYSILVISIGAVFLGVGAAAASVLAGVTLIAVGTVAFVVSSVIALRGEAGVVRDKR